MTRASTTPVRVVKTGRIKDGLITLVGILGALAIVWLVCSLAFGLSIVVFKTGSMGPTMPAGAAAVVREIPASEVAVGDVITVERPGELPITHRVVSVEPDPASTEGRVIQLKGDANEQPDVAPYTLNATKVVLWSMPGLGTVLSIAQSPFFLGLTTLLVVLLIVWAFWPARRRPQTDATKELSEVGSG